MEFAARSHGDHKGTPLARPVRNLEHRPRQPIHQLRVHRRAQNAGLAISVDGRGPCMDNIFIERLWPSLKYEAVYLL